MLFLLSRGFEQDNFRSLYAVSLIPSVSQSRYCYSSLARLNITLEERTNTVHGSDHSDHSDHSSSSSRTDDEDSTGTGVNLRQASSGQGHDYSDPADEQDGSWLSDSYPEDIGPSDSASRPRISHQKRQFVEAPQPVEARRPSFRRHISREPVRQLPHPRAHRSEPSDPPESVDSHDEWQGYARGQPQHYSRPYAHYTSGYPSPHAYQTYPAPSAIPGGLQKMVPYGFSPYQTPTAGPAPSYFAHGHHGGPSHEMIPHASSAGYLPYTSQGYPMPMPVPMSPPVAYPAYGGMYAHPPTPTAPSAPPAQPSSAVTTPPPPPSASDTSKEDEKYARLEKLLLDQKAEQLEREAAIEEAAKAKIAKAEAEAKKAEEISKASAAAASAAREEVVKQYQAAEKDKAAKAEAEAQKAEEIAKASASAAAAAREEVEKEHQAAAEANKEKAAAAKPPAPPKEKDKPIKFKDAIGRRFNFPFDVCNTWSVGYSRFDRIECSNII